MMESEGMFSELQYAKDKALIDELKEVESFLDYCEEMPRDQMRMGKYQKLKKYLRRDDR